MYKYCVRCGRKVPENEPLIDGYCIDCYLKYRGIFVTKPVLNITICPRCGSWMYRGEWRDPLPFRDIIRRILISEAYRFIDRQHVNLLDATILSEPYRINESQYAVKALLHVVVEEYYPLDLEKEIVLNINRKVCPKCLAYAGKSHRALVQIRSVNGSFSSEEEKIINKALNDPGVAGDIVEIKKNKYGLDIKFLTSVAAKRLSTILNRLTGARIIESFKPVRYNPDKGRWSGITTLSVRLPSIKKGDLVEFEGRPGVVIDVSPHGIKTEFLDDGRIENIRFEKYWRGDLKKAEDLVYSETYSVIAEDKTTIYLLDEETGNIIDYPRTKTLANISVGDKVRAVRVRDKVYMIKNSELGDNNA
ncbi:60S ribosomal export protein NMD3 [Staphylothermus hellenicus]|uniref:NMD3 family protein n=1 Tax=Staphylothermus hellenicus (strain DSM 12710 / JCM 10830 / BK20S6-10-b1 / P8) TaxID=591019 RepID=D7D9K7_STAHD|nr:60S ribosomal export protein NMD3 [Staphylothermus hellenicus]ADI32453.1 NMD3 family protein [Staphylothermus hellenicus DSM 12710]